MSCVWGLNSWVYGDAIPEMEDSGEGTFCKFITFQMNYSTTLNSLMLGNSCTALSVLRLVHALFSPNRRLSFEKCHQNSSGVQHNSEMRFEAKNKSSPE